MIKIETHLGAIRLVTAGGLVQLIAGVSTENR
jgi:hypothetical protein